MGTKMSLINAQHNKRGLSMLLCGIAVYALIGCQTTGSKTLPKRVISGNVLDGVLHPDAEITQNDDGKTTDSLTPSSKTSPSVLRDIRLGSGQYVRPGPVQADFITERAGSVELAFDRAPVEQIVNAVLGNILGADFIIDPAVKGEVTFRTAKPVKKSDLPAILNQALNLVNVSLIETAPNTFTVIPSSQARRFARAPGLSSSGARSGMVIVPLEYISASEMARVLQPFTPQGSTIQVDSKREMLILSGEPAQINVLLDTMEMFDVDWLEQMSFGVFETRFAPPETLIEELEKVFGGANSPIGSQIEFIPMPRLGSVLVIAKRAHRIAQAEEWIRKLDRNVGGEGRRFQFLSIVNADAEELADTISDLVGSNNGQNSNQSQNGNPAGPEQAKSRPTNNNNTSSASGQKLRIRADLATNSLIIYGTDEEYRQIANLVQKLDVLPDQVLIEAVIAEVTLNDELRFGVQWFFDSRTGGTATFSDAGSGAVSSRFPGFAYAFSGNYVKVAMNALAAVTDIEIVASPQIITLDNQTATLQVGDQVPVVTQSAVSVDNPNAPIVNSVQFRDTGILLTVTPRVNDGNMVILEVAQEVSNAVPTLTSGIDAPTIQQRRFDTVVTIADGDTLALGGLIRTSRTVGDTGIPFLKDIPILGNAFSGKSDSRGRTELVIFMTPHIIRSREDARRANDHIRSRLQRLKLTKFTDEQE
jgi:general secretion pathway protein D